MLGPEMNAGLDAGPIQKMCGACSVPDPDFGENLTSLICRTLSDSSLRPLNLRLSPLNFFEETTQLLAIHFCCQKAAVPCFMLQVEVNVQLHTLQALRL